ncbi:MAG: hypothetical protein AVDCRST_MAG26-765, partial [uncultured Chloroflexia bacterium]
RGDIPWECLAVRQPHRCVRAELRHGARAPAPVPARAGALGALGDRGVAGGARRPAAAPYV